MLNWKIWLSYELDIQNYPCCKTNIVQFRSKLYQNLLAQMAVLHALDHQELWYAKPCLVTNRQFCHILQQNDQQIPAWHHRRAYNQQDKLECLPHPREPHPGPQFVTVHWLQHCQYRPRGSGERQTPSGAWSAVADYQGKHYRVVLINQLLDEMTDNRACLPGTH